MLGALATISRMGLEFGSSFRTRLELMRGHKSGWKIIMSIKWKMVPHLKFRISQLGMSIEESIKFMPKNVARRALGLNVLKSHILLILDHEDLIHISL